MSFVDLSYHKTAFLSKIQRQPVLTMRFCVCPQEIFLRALIWRALSRINVVMWSEERAKNVILAVQAVNNIYNMYMFFVSLL